MDIKKTVRKLKEHDENALEEVMKYYTPLVTSIIYNVGKGTLSTEDIEETAIDTFVILWKNAESVSEETFKGYLCTVAKSKAYDKIRTSKNKMMVSIEELELEDEFSLEGKIESEESDSELENAISTIKEPDREIMIRYYFYYQKIGKIAEVMGLTPDNVKVKLHRARTKLKKVLLERGFSI